MPYYREKVTKLNFQQYLDKAKQFSEEQTEKTLTYYTTKLADALIEYGYTSDPDSAVKQAKQVLLGTQTIRINASEVAPVEDAIQKNKKAFDISQQEAFLFISAPRLDISADEEKMRKLQYESLKEACKKIIPESADKRDVTVYTKEDLFSAVDKFMAFVREEKRQNFSIIFNGHGVDKGLTVEKNGSVETIPLEDFKKKVNEIYDQDFPTAGRIVFAQCYGHMHDNTIGGIEVIHFTSASNVFTYSVTTNTPDGELKSSTHKELNNHFTQEQEVAGKNKVPLEDGMEDLSIENADAQNCNEC